MDEQTSRKIVIKFNGANQDYEENLQQKKETEEREPKLNVSSWDEKRKVEKEMAAAKEEKEKDEDDFPWVLPEDPKVVVNDAKKSKQKKRNHPYVASSSPLTSISPKKYIVPILLAIIVGIGFGTFANQLLSKEQATPASSVVEESQPASENKQNPPVSGEKGTLSLPLFVIQEGLYSKESGADTVVSNLSERGLAASKFKADEGFYVFIGIAMTAEEGKKLKQLMSDKGIEPIDKQISVEMTASDPEETKQVMETMIQMSSKLLISPSEANEEQIQTLKEQIAKLDSPPSSLQTASDLLSKKSPTEEQLWNVQNQLLQYISKNGEVK
ncbi:hypothetical protein [Bacillus sp. FJAT-47783]|uniref:hypothetical protein n=1 Tax=Bacillus sp. FJAT-47783 TaxID=2922712 RepID=UPI001FAE4788|nr:hypothetical protein [Bacillus sp. FJAT-47783]